MSKSLHGSDTQSIAVVLILVLFLGLVVGGIQVLQVDRELTAGSPALHGSAE